MAVSRTISGASGARATRDGRAKFHRIVFIVASALCVASEGAKAVMARRGRTTEVTMTDAFGARGTTEDDSRAVDGAGGVGRPRVDATRAYARMGADGGGTAADGRAARDSATSTTRTVRVRECGSPAIDGYAKVNLTCMAESATAREWDGSKEARARLEARVEPHASYDGIAVRWGINHTVKTAEECAERCREHEIRPNGRGAEVLPCNVFVYCPLNVDADRCFEADAHEHFPGDCWLKFSETPENVEVNQRGANDAPGFVRDGKTFAQRHPNAPNLTHWTSGVLLPPDVENTPGTLGPRAQW